jgi:hypothetical protein
LLCNDRCFWQFDHLGDFLSDVSPSHTITSGRSEA